MRQNPAAPWVSALLCGVLLGQSAGVRAAEPAIDLLSWEECVKRAEQESPQLKAARATLESTREQEGVARAGFLPQVTGTLSMTKASGTAVATTGSAIAPVGTTYQAGLNGSWNLFSGLQDLSKLSQARANTRAGEAVFAAAQAQVSYDLRVAFDGLLFAQRSIELTHEIIRRREENQGIVQLRFEGGRENRGSVLLSRAYVQQARYDDLQARNAIESSRAQLRRVLGLQEGAPIEVHGETPSHEPPSRRPDFEELARRTPATLQSVAQEQAAESAVDQSRSAFFPSLAASGSVGSQGPSFFPKNDRWSVGLTLTFQLFNGLSDLAGIRSALKSRDSSRYSLDNTARAQLATLVQQYNGYTEAVMKLRMDESFRDAALLRAQIARNKYNQGLQTFDDWDLIEGDLIARQKAYLASRRDRAVAEAAWEQSQGHGLFGGPLKGAMP